jgi:hypothetical protein
MTTTRVQASKPVLPLPGVAALPYRRDRVFVHRGGRQLEASLEGFNMNGKPIVDVARSAGKQIEKIEFRVVEPVVDPIFDSIQHSQFWLPLEEEVRQFDNILDTMMPGGITPRQLVAEFEGRGHAIFLVGGTVRDIVAGRDSNDLDLAGTMSIPEAFGLVNGMGSKDKRELDEQNLLTGFLRIGWAPGGKRLFVDYCTMKVDFSGHEWALFGQSILEDSRNRDFTCNAVYYSPTLRLLVDPSGTGLLDISNKDLRPILPPGPRDALEPAKRAIRLFKFIARGYKPHVPTCEQMLNSIGSAFNAIGPAAIIGLLLSQIINKNPSGAEKDLSDLQLAFAGQGKAKEWVDHIEPCRALLMKEVRKKILRGLP